MSLATIVATLKAEYRMGDDDAQAFVTKAIEGGEATERGIDAWYEDRFKPNTVIIDEAGYAQMCVSALKIVRNTAGTDYGSSRQRDLGQLWADMTRGYLGERAFTQFLEERWGMHAELNHELGDLEDFLPSDVHKVSEGKGALRDPKIGISVKTTKANGIWCDIPGAQFFHSDAHVLVKLAVGRDHLFAYFKSISVFRDKVLKNAVEAGSLTEAESKRLFDSLPSFTPVVAYISGFIPTDKTFERPRWGGHRGRKHFTVNEWKGRCNEEHLEEIRTSEELPAGGRVKFLGIDHFSHYGGFLFNTGSLCWTKAQWTALVARL